MRNYFSVVFYFLFVGSAFSQTINPPNIFYRTDSVQLIQEVVVTGTNYATARSELPFSIHIIDEAKLKESACHKVLNTLSLRIPSLFVTERGLGGFGISTGGSGGIKIRGVGGATTGQVLMLVDGQPQFAGVFSHPVSDSYTMNHVERVEVISGPASVLYGSNAMGGAINIITKDPQKKGISQCVSVDYGSYNTLKYTYLNELKVNRFSTLLSLSYNQTDGHRDFFDFKQASGFYKIGYDFSQHFQLKGDFSLMKFSGKDPTYMSEEIKNPYVQNVVRGASSIKMNNKFTNTTGSLHFFYSWGNHFIYDPKDFHSVDTHLGIIGYQSFSFHKSNKITLGMDYTRYGGEILKSGGQNYNIKNKATLKYATIQEGSPYIVLSQSFFEKLFTLNMGLRYVINDHFKNSWIPQGGISFFSETNSILKISVAKGYRNPSFKELYLYKMANSSLNPESMLNYEMAFTQYLLNRKIRLELTAYLAKGKNLIELVPYPELGHPLYENSGKFANKGIEFTCAFQISKSLQVDGSYSYLKTDIQNLTGAPKNQLFGSFTWKMSNQFSLNMQARHVDELYIGESKVETYTLLNSKLTYTPQKYIDLSFSVDNMTNQKYMINWGYEMPGVIFTGGMVVKF